MSISAAVLSILFSLLTYMRRLFNYSDSLTALTSAFQSKNLCLNSRQAYPIRGMCKIAILLSPSFMTGCVISQPVWLDDSGVAELCSESGTFSFTHNGVTRPFKVNLVDDKEIFESCGHDRYGQPAAACIINSYDIYVKPGILCPRHMAHELSHGFGLHYVDRPRVGMGDFHG